MASTISIPDPAAAPDWAARGGHLDLPEELESRLGDSPRAQAAFEAWTPIQQWDVTWFIEESAELSTRQRRARRALSVLEGRLACLGT